MSRWEPLTQSSATTNMWQGPLSASPQCYGQLRLRRGDLISWIVAVIDRGGHRRNLAPDRRCLTYPSVDLWGLIGLALLAAPRVVLHDLGVISEGTVVNALFVFVPILIWIVVVLWARVPDALLTLLVVGVIYGILLAAGHQIFWTAQFDGQPPRLGGRLSELDPGVSSSVVRVFAVLSSIITGAVVGAAAGLVTWLLSRSQRRRGRRLGSDAASQG